MRNDWREAVINGNVHAISHLIAEGVDINKRDQYGQTALMLAARHGHVNVVKLMILHGADLDVTAKYGLSALMLAVSYRHSDIAKQLINAGADTQLIGNGAPGFTGKNAYDLAQQNGLSDLVDYMKGNKN